MAEKVGIKNLKQIQEVEYCLTSYFIANIIPMMKATKNELQLAQAKEISDYQMSFAGSMRTFAATANPYAAEDSLQYLKATGDACSKTAEDYVAMVAERIAADEDCQKDLVKIADEWRDAIVKAVGRERYDEISEQLGADLALSYVDYRIEQMMIDDMVRSKMPKSTAEYIIQKGAENSLLGLPQTLSKSPLQAEIDNKAEASFNPSNSAKWGARGVALGFDLASMGGIGSWSGLARVAGMEVVFAGMENYLDKKTAAQKGLTVEQCVSNALWGTTTNVFPAIRKDNWQLKAYESDYLQNLNSSLSKKLPLPTEKPLWENSDWETRYKMSAQRDWSDTSASFVALSDYSKSENKKQVMPKEKVQSSESKAQSTEFKVQSSGESTIQNSSTEVQKAEMKETETQTDLPLAEESQDNSSSWASILQSAVGLEGIGDIGRNLPYVISMLPDMLVGLLTGKTKSVSLKGEMIPMASILLGLFVKNPLLKIVLIGMGGANLINKMGHEAIERQQPKQQFRQYQDEPLNARILNPKIQGNVMVATIDNVPCSITLNDNAAAAYASGALPLNVLANAILAKHDEAQAYAQDTYRNVQMDQALQKDRGVALR